MGKLKDLASVKISQCKCLCIYCRQMLHMAHLRTLIKVDAKNVSSRNTWRSLDADCGVSIHRVDWSSLTVLNHAKPFRKQASST